MDKVISKQIFKINKIKSPKYFVLEKKDFNASKLKSLIKKSLLFPLVVKPTNEGSSMVSKFVII